LNFDAIRNESPEFGLIVDGLVTLIEEKYVDADLIVTVANGANRLGMAY